MPIRTFSNIGRVSSIDSLFEGIQNKQSFSPESAHRLMLEGMDFDLSYFPLKHLGYKAVVEVTGELYAGLRQARELSVVLGVSSKLDYEQIEQFWSGVRVAAEEFGYSRIHLDMIPSVNGLCISLSASGDPVEGCLPRAESKDLLCISGSLGSAYFGQQVLERKPDELEKYKMMVADYLKPELREHTPEQLKSAGLLPSSGVFVTRGLADAVMRICRNTGLGAKVYADRIPFEGNSFSLGKELDIDPVSAAMNGGEDCRLLFTIPILKAEQFRKDFQTYDIIGHLALPEVGAAMVTPDGVELPLRAQGWPEEDL